MEMEDKMILSINDMDILPLPLSYICDGNGYNGNNGQGLLNTSDNKDLSADKV
jgi:hypothetical protein